jgi:hypothetical protein
MTYFLQINQNRTLLESVYKTLPTLVTGLTVLVNLCPLLNITPGDDPFKKHKHPNAVTFFLDNTFNVLVAKSETVPKSGVASPAHWNILYIYDTRTSNHSSHILDD